MTTSQLQLYYRITSFENHLKTSWTGVLQLGNHTQTGRRGGDAEWAGPTPTVRWLRIRREEGYPSYRGPLWGARAPQLRVPVLGRGVPITSSCERQWRLCPSEREGYCRLRHPLDGPAHRLTCSQIHLLWALVQGQQLKGDRDIREELNWLASGEDWRGRGQHRCLLCWARPQPSQHTKQKQTHGFREQTDGCQMRDRQKRWRH